MEKVIGEYGFLLPGLPRPSLSSENINLAGPAPFRGGTQA